jgi:hypothetical protein
MYPHRIRLRGPWDTKFTSSEGRVTEARINLPATWAALSRDIVGPIQLVRNFGRPRELDADEHVWLIWSDVSQTGNLWFNGNLVLDAMPKGGAFDVTSLIEGRNELTIEIGSPGSPNARLGDFALEVRGMVYLEEVQFVREGSQVQGVVRGEPVQNLELYLLLFGETVHRQLIEASPKGVLFCIPCPRPSAVPETSEFPPIRLELIAGSNLWWRVDLPADFASSDSPIHKATVD